MNEGVELQLHALLTSALDETVVSFRSGPLLFAGKRTPGSYYKRTLDGLENR